MRYRTMTQAERDGDFSTASGQVTIRKPVYLIQTSGYQRARLPIMPEKITPIYRYRTRPAASTALA